MPQGGFFWPAAAVHTSPRLFRQHPQRHPKLGRPRTAMDNPLVWVDHALCSITCARCIQMHPGLVPKENRCSHLPGQSATTCSAPPIRSGGIPTTRSSAKETLLLYATCLGRAPPRAQLPQSAPVAHAPRASLPPTPPRWPPAWRRGRCFRTSTACPAAGWQVQRAVSSRLRMDIK